MPRDPAIVVIGATGYTGRLIARELAGGPAPLVVAGRSPERLDRLAAELGPRATPRVVDVEDPASLDRLIRPGDVVINCAGPFGALGEPVVRSCLRGGAHYLDTSGEQAFNRTVHRRYDDDAREAGVAVVVGMAFEYALGDCAAALAAEGLSEPLRSLDVVYAWGGAASSAGTRRTSVGILGRRAWLLEDGTWRRRPPGARRRTVTMASGRTLHAVTFGAGEVVTVPRHLDVETVRGWLVLGRRLAGIAPLLAPALPVVVPLLRPGLERLAVRGGDARPEERQASGFTIRLELEDARGTRRAVEVAGRDPYAVTASIAALGAERAARPDAPRGVLPPARLVDPAAFFASLADRGVVLAPG